MLGLSFGGLATLAFLVAPNHRRVPAHDQAYTALLVLQGFMFAVVGWTSFHGAACVQPRWGLHILDLCSMDYLIVACVLPNCTPINVVLRMKQGRCKYTPSLPPPPLPRGWNTSLFQPLIWYTPPERQFNVSHNSR